jgi:hypothetical protein
MGDKSPKAKAKSMKQDETTKAKKKADAVQKAAVQAVPLKKGN